MKGSTGLKVSVCVFFVWGNYLHSCRERKEILVKLEIQEITGGWEIWVILETGYAHVDCNQIMLLLFKMLLTRDRVVEMVFPV